MTPTERSRVKAALWYAGQGFGVFPVWSPNDDGSCRCPAGRACGQSGKHPLPVTRLRAATLDQAKDRTFLAAVAAPHAHAVRDSAGAVPATVIAGPPRHLVCQPNLDCFASERNADRSRGGLDHPDASTRFGRRPHDGTPGLAGPSAAVRLPKLVA